MDCGAATSDPSDATTLSQVPRRFRYLGQRQVRDSVCVRCDCAASLFQGAFNGEEDLSEEEKARRRAERRKAKRKVRPGTFCSDQSGCPAVGDVSAKVTLLSSSAVGNARSRSRPSNTRAPRG